MWLPGAASNHTTAVDDPAVLAAMAPLSYLLQSRRVRWAVCARDRCFNHSQTVSDIFATMKVLPIERGAGLDQKVRRSSCLYILCVRHPFPFRHTRPHPPTHELMGIANFSCHFFFAPRT